MGRTAVVLSSAHVVDGGGHGVDVTYDPDGGRNATAPSFTSPGVDALALPGDSVALEDSSGTGCEQATGYADTANAGKAAPGEVRLYARDSSGAVVLELWLKGDRSMHVTNGLGSFEMASNGAVTINGVTIDALGNISTPGDVTALSDSVPVTLATHVHLSASPGSATGPAISPPVP